MPKTAIFVIVFPFQCRCWCSTSLHFRLFLVHPFRSIFHCFNCFSWCRCDRILWFGSGLRQLSYVRGESKFSDHRPVYAVFLAEVETLNRCKAKKSLSSVSARVEVEELLPRASCVELYDQVGSRSLETVHCYCLNSSKS